MYPLFHFLSWALIYFITKTVFHQNRTPQISFCSQKRFTFALAFNWVLALNTVQHCYWIPDNPRFTLNLFSFLQFSCMLFHKLSSNKHFTMSKDTWEMLVQHLWVIICWFPIPVLTLTCIYTLNINTLLISIFTTTLNMHTRVTSAEAYKKNTSEVCERFLIINPPIIALLLTSPAPVKLRGSFFNLAHVIHIGWNKLHCLRNKEEINLENIILAPE